MLHWGRWGKRAVWAGVLGLAALAGGMAVAESGLTPREEQLLSVIERLEQRVEELEQKMEVLERDGQYSAVVEEAVTAAREAVLESRLQALEERPRPFDLSPDSLQVYWDDTLRLRTVDDRFSMAFNARFQTDFAFFNQPQDLRLRWNPVLRQAFYDKVEDGVEVRNAWFGVTGRL